MRFTVRPNTLIIREGGWVGSTVHGSANRKKKERGWVRGFLIQSALSASGSQSHTTSIFHTRRSQGAGAAGVCVVCRVLCLHRVCVFVGEGGGIIYGKTTQLCHLANIWASAPTSHSKNSGRWNHRDLSFKLIRAHTHTHTHLEMHEHTLNNAGDNAELVAGLNGFFLKSSRSR